MELARNPATIAICAAFLIVWQSGCATNAATMSIQQDHAPPSQKNMALKSDWAYTARQDDRRLCLADFALPGAVDGPRDFRVFIAMPGNVESAEIGRGPSSARGFFLQKVGRLRGKTEFTGGSVRISTARLNPRQRELEIEVECADGTRVSGKAKLREADDELRVFLMQHAGDVAALDAASPGQTGKRRGEASEQSDNEKPSVTAADVVTEGTD